MQEINGPWQIAIDPENVGREQDWFNNPQKEVRPAVVPGVIQQAYPGYHGAAWYWTTFVPLRTVRNHERYLLRFEAVDYFTQVWINGKLAGEHEGAETPFEFDVTAAIKNESENLLAVRVLNPFEEGIDGFKLAEIPHRNKVSANYQPGTSFNFGGIISPVTLNVVPSIRIVDLFVQPEISTGKIKTVISIQNDTGAEVAGKLFGSVEPAAGDRIFDSFDRKFNYPRGWSSHELTLQVAQVHPWNLDDPYLYQVQVNLSADEKYVHTQKVRCGFRELRVQRGYFRLNGKRIILKSTHTCNHFPIGQVVPTVPDFMRRDLILAKACGYNTVRFIAGMPYKEQLDICDEIGLMVYEENLASWNLADSVEMKNRFNRSVREMILRDRNHPSVVIWGLLNEMPDGPVFRHAVESLNYVRDLDSSRLVLLNSGRLDCDPRIGSLSNPGSRTWEYEWGVDASDAVAVNNMWDYNQGNYFDGMGDLHVYPAVPHSPGTNNILKNLGKNTKPVFLSEYGTGSMMNVIRNLSLYEQHNAYSELEDVKLTQSMADKFEADWKRWKFDGTYSFPEDLLHTSENFHVHQRSLGFDLIRSNPKICGFNLTGMLDHGMTGEGVWTFWRECKPGTCDALCDGWSPLRWCLFMLPTHGYVGRKIRLEAVLANEDILVPGQYPVRFRICGPTGPIWKKETTLIIPDASPDNDGPLAVPVLSEEVILNGPTGEYELAASLDRGGAPTGNRHHFFMTDPATYPEYKTKVKLWGVGQRIEKWLESRGIPCESFTTENTYEREIILVGDDLKLNADKVGWRNLAEQMARGSFVVFLSPEVFKKTSRSMFKQIGNVRTVSYSCEVANLPQEDWAVFSKEFHENIHYEVADLTNKEYFIEFGMVDHYWKEPGQRIFSIWVNDRCIYPEFDIIHEADGPHRVVFRKIKVQPENGRLDIYFKAIKDYPTLSRIRIFDDLEELLDQDDALSCSAPAWLPLSEKGQRVLFNDWLYHKECVAKRHPIFEGLNYGMMDPNYYGAVISHQYFTQLQNPDDVIAAAFAVGYPCPGGYASGLMMAEYSLAAGKFLINTLKILENIDIHPAADRLMLNMIHYAGLWTKSPPAEIPSNFSEILRSIGYDGN